MNRLAARSAVALLLGIVAAVIPGAGAHGGQLGDWGQAAEVVAVNGPAAEGCPIEAPDGRSLYVVSTRGLGGDQDIFVAPRSPDGTISAPQVLPAPVNSSGNDFCPTPLRGKSLLFVSDRSGPDFYGNAACGAGDIYVTRLSPATGTWSPPRNLGCAADGGPNSPGFEYGPSLVETDEGTFLFYSTGSSFMSPDGSQQIVMSTMRADGTFGPGIPVAGEVNSDTAHDMMPNVRKDGLEIVFASNRPGGQGAFDLWSATRSSTSEPWSSLRNLGTAVNGSLSETRPSLSWDGSRLYFGRAGEIYLSHR